jgi:hypothetical protein
MCCEGSDVLELQKWHISSVFGGVSGLGSMEVSSVLHNRLLVYLALLEPLFSQTTPHLSKTLIRQDDKLQPSVIVQGNNGILSPDGDLLAFSDIAETHTRLLVKDLRTGEQYVLVSSRIEKIFVRHIATFSPDSKHLLFAGTVGGESNYFPDYLYSLPIDQSRLARLDQINRSPYNSFSVAPDANWDVVQQRATAELGLVTLTPTPGGFRGNPKYEAFRYPAEVRERLRKKELLKEDLIDTRAPDLHSVASARYAPDGKLIAVGRFNNATNTEATWIVSPSGTGFKLLATDATPLSWPEPGTIYLRSKTLGIDRFEIATGKRTKVESGPIHVAGRFAEGILGWKSGSQCEALGFDRAAAPTITSLPPLINRQNSRHQAGDPEQSYFQQATGVDATKNGWIAVMFRPYYENNGTILVYPPQGSR